MKKKNRMHSGFRPLYMILMALAGIMSLTFYISIRSMYRSISVNEKQQLQSLVQEGKSQVEEGLTAIDMQLKVEMYRIFNHQMVQNDEIEENYERQQVRDEFNEIIRESGNVDAIFLKSRKDGFHIAGCVQDLSAQRDLETLLRKKELDTVSLNDAHWWIVRLGSHPYFCKVYALGHYEYGILSAISHYSERSADLGKAIVSGNKTLYSEGIRHGGVEARADLELLRASLVYYSSVVTQDSYYKNIVITMVGLIAMVVGAFLALFTFIQGRIRKPIGDLVKASETIRGGDYEYRIPEKGRSEFLILQKAFNRMVDTITGLKIQQYEQKMQLQSQELKLLRQQLKPHFYLNAITVISGLTYRNENELIRQYIQILADHVRYMISGSPEASLENELVHLKNYFEMQKIKSPKGLVYYIYCDDDLKKQTVPHLMLYTIAENSFKYALGYQKQMSLYLDCHRKDGSDNTVEIEFEDNGPGFPKEVLEELRAAILPSAESEETENGRHIGLRNLSRTLQLMYGGQASMTLSNSEPHGVRIVIEMPVMEVKEDHENSDRG